MSNKQPPSPGTAIDAVLAPFVKDEAELEQRLETTSQQIEDLRSEAEQIEHDLDVIRTAKVEALRQAAADDPLLREAFLNPIGSTADAGAEADRHPLLSPAG
ncbi:MAG: hypothetical protein AAF333_06280 [Planctomycetota bacterium]